MRKKKILQALVCLILCVGSLLCVSCSDRKKSSDRILSELMERCDGLPEGEILRSDAGEGSEGYASSAVLRAMYGEDAEDLLRRCDFSIYISSFAAPYEIAVIRAVSRADARAISSLFFCRADELRVALRRTEFEGLTNEIRVLVSGRYVVMGITEDGETFADLAKRTMP